MFGRSQSLLPDRFRRRLATQDIWSHRHVPKVKLYDPTGIATWLIAAIDGDRLYGLCDFGNGRPMVSVISLHHVSELGASRADRICRDRRFRTTQALSVWLKVARRTGSIVAAEIELGRAGVDLALARCGRLAER